MPREKLQDANGLAAISLQLRHQAAGQQAASKGFSAPCALQLHAAKPATTGRQLNSRPDSERHVAQRSPTSYEAAGPAAPHPIAAPSARRHGVTSSASSSESDSRDDTMERCHGGSSGSEADTTSGEGAGNTRDQHSNSVPAEALQNRSTRNSDQDTAFRSFYLDHFTSFFGEELQVFREADSGKTVVHTDLVLHAINATADAFPSEQKRLFLQDSQQAVNPDGPVISLTASVKDRSSDWL